MDKKNRSQHKLAVKDLTPRHAEDVRGGLFTTQVKEAWAKAATATDWGPPQLPQPCGNTWAPCGGNTW